MKPITKSELMETLDTLGDRKSAILFNLFFKGEGVLLNIEKKNYFLNRLFRDVKTDDEFLEVSRLIRKIDGFLIKDELYNLILNADLRFLYGLYLWLTFCCNVKFLSSKQFSDRFKRKERRVANRFLLLKKRALPTSDLTNLRESIDKYTKEISITSDNRVTTGIFFDVVVYSYIDFHSFLSLNFDRVDFARRLIFYFDCLHGSCAKNSAFLEKACSEIKRYQFIDGLTYFDEKNKIQMDWLYSYILKKISPALGESFKKERCKDVHAFLFALVDVLGCLSVEKKLTDSDERILILDVKNRGDFLKSVKLAAYQKNARDSRKNVGKYHLPLTKASKKQLKELSDIFNKNEYEVLEMVINSFYERSVLDDKGQKKY